MKQYKCTATPWAVVKYEGVKPVVVKRCKTYSDADGYCKIFQQMNNDSFVVVFDLGNDQVLVSVDKDRDSKERWNQTK